jgi:hypothetical protein
MGDRNYLIHTNKYRLQISYFDEKKVNIFFRSKEQNYPLE